MSGILKETRAEKFISSLKIARPMAISGDGGRERRSGRCLMGKPGRPDRPEGLESNRAVEETGKSGERRSAEMFKRAVENGDREILVGVLRDWLRK